MTINNFFSTEIVPLARDARTALHTELFTVGDRPITPIRILFVLLLIILLFRYTKKLRVFLQGTFLKYFAEPKQAYGLAKAAEIFAWVLGVMTIIQLVGPGVSGLFTILAALGVGLGFGLQNIFNNTISGIIMLFEQPIRVGDIVEIEGNAGLVESIGWRATKMLTWDNSEVLIPNSRLLESDLINWTLSESVSRIPINFGVSYSSNVELVEKLALQAAGEESEVLEVPAPNVVMTDFGSSSLDFRLHVWTKNRMTLLATAGRIRVRLLHLFRENGVEIPFPQRDLWLRNFPKDSAPDSSDE